MDRGAWLAKVHRVAKMRLKRLCTHRNFLPHHGCLKDEMIGEFSGSHGSKEISPQLLLVKMAIITNNLNQGS